MMEIAVATMTSEQSAARLSLEVRPGASRLIPCSTSRLVRCAPSPWLAGATSPSVELLRVLRTDAGFCAECAEAALAGKVISPEDLRFAGGLFSNEGLAFMVTYDSRCGVTDLGE